MHLMISADLKGLKICGQVMSGARTHCLGRPLVLSKPLRFVGKPH